MGLNSSSESRTPSPTSGRRASTSGSNSWTPQPSAVAVPHSGAPTERSCSLTVGAPASAARRAYRASLSSRFLSRVSVVAPVPPTPITRAFRIESLLRSSLLVPERHLAVARGLALVEHERGDVLLSRRCVLHPKSERTRLPRRDTMAEPLRPRRC